MSWDDFVKWLTAGCFGFAAIMAAAFTVAGQYDLAGSVMVGIAIGLFTILAIYMFSKMG